MKRQILGLCLVGLAILGGLFLAQTSLGKSMRASLFTQIPVYDVTTATLHTDQGDITLEIFDKTVPTIANNFLQLADAGMYDGVIFHRAIKGFMIQSGDFEHANGTGGHAYGGGEIPDEIVTEYSHGRGMLSMANRGPDTNGSQFFIVQNDAPQLNGSYSIFGQVLEGMPIVDALAGAETGFMDRPLTPASIKYVTIRRIE